MYSKHTHKPLNIKWDRGAQNTLTTEWRKAGIWFKDDKVYDVSGHFIAELDEFYSDDKWKLHREDGSVKVTDSKEGCLAAAKPEVEEEYQNYCVECMPDYFEDQVTTFVVPITPIYLKSTRNFGRGGIGVAFNGVKYDPPAPTPCNISSSYHCTFG